MKKLVTIFGPSECQLGDAIYERAYEAGGILADAGFAIVTGGYEGVMEAASKGAHERGGGTVGVTANVYFNRGRATNAFIKKELRVSSAVDRLMELISLADAYVACGMSPGTLVEVTTVWDFFIKGFIETKPLILLGEEWEAFCASLFSQPGYENKKHFITIAKTPAEAAAIIITHLGVQEKLPDLTVLQ